MWPGVERIAGIAEVLLAVPQKALLAEEVGVMAFGGGENYPEIGRASCRERVLVAV